MPGQPIFPPFALCTEQVRSHMDMKGCLRQGQPLKGGIGRSCHSPTRVLQGPRVIDWGPDRGPPL